MIYSLQTEAWLSCFTSGQDQTMAEEEEEAEDEVGLRPYSSQNLTIRAATTVGSLSGRAVASSSLKF